MKPTLVLLTFATLIFAGCSGTQEGMIDEPGGPQSLGSDEAGTVTGVVTDEELAPVAGAQVTILELLLNATTATDGTFAIHGVPPGTHQLFVQALGYQSIGRQIDVVVGVNEPLRLTLTLLPVIVPYTEMIPKRGYSICDLNTIYVALTLAAPGCEAKATMFELEVNETWRYGVVELQYQAAESFNLVSDLDGLCFLDNSNPCFIWMIGRSPLRFDARPNDANFSRTSEFLYPAESFTWIVSAYSAGMFQEEIQGSGTCLRQGQPPCGGVGLSLGTTFDLYVSLFHHAEPSDKESYSAIPDG